MIKKDQLLFKQGSLGQHAYIILKGEIALFENSDREEDNSNKFERAVENIKREKAKIANHLYFESGLHNGEPLYVKSKLKIFLQTGDFFGELSLMGKPNRRLNAMAKENSVLLEMNLVAFELVMKERSVVEQLRFTDFVSENFPGFSQHFTKSFIA